MDIRSHECAITGWTVVQTLCLRRHVFPMGGSVTLFFPQTTWRSHPSTDFDAKWLKRRGFTNTCAFWGKNCNFLKPLTHRYPKPPKFALRKFSLDFALNIGVSRVNTPYYSSEPNKSVIVYRQSGDEKLKNMYLNFEQRVYHVISHMRNDDSALCLCANEVWGRIPLR